MKKYLLSLVTILLFTNFTFGQIVTIPDANFKAALIEEGVDLNNDGEIQVSEAEAQTSLEVYNKNISSLEGINSFINLISINASTNQLTSVNINNLVNLEELHLPFNQLSNISFSNLSNLKHLRLYHNSLSNIDLSELTTIETLDLSQNNLTTININDLINLRTLNAGNNQFTNLNLSNSINLEEIFLSHNQLTSINVSNSNSLKQLYITNNQLSNLDVSELINLIVLSAQDNQLTNINLEGSINLLELSLWNNQLSSIDLSNLTNLNSLSLENNSLTSLDLSSLISLNLLRTDNNSLVNLDISNLSNLSLFHSLNNPLVSLNIKNGKSDYFIIDFDDTLEYICADEFEINSIQEQIDIAGTETNINSYCSFTPGGEFYTVQGHSTIDIDNNGCDPNDTFYPNLKFNITDGTTTGDLIANESGEYSINVQEGEHTVTPILDNPSYYSVSPESAIINFPVEASPFTQNFCLTPLGDFYDLEVSIIPLTEARPGFDTEYKIIYKNKGTTTLSGEISFTYQDIYMDLVLANPTPDEQMQSLLKWDYINLLPEESRSIFVTMNINTPTDTPPVNGDDILVFEVLGPIIGDETPINNTATLNQTVINSYDPNDKTCIEGEEILPSHVGEYLHYVIRFENTGTASAINVVIKDEIDISKFDIASLTPTDASHSFRTRVNNNIVEFLFENIQLPYDDENNDGYVAFKIKTLPTLELNDKIENKAEIYFDFNHPIITNNYITEVKENNSTNESISNSVTTFPNPTENNLIIDSKTTIKSISIIDSNGKRLQTIKISYSITEYELDISNLAQGVYFLEVISKDKKEVKKFIKK